MIAKTLYRMYNRDNQLLYVGMSWHPRNRFGAHAKDSFWFIDVTTITLKRYGTEGECREAEAHAIQDENPIYNNQQTKPIRNRRTKTIPNDNDTFYLIVGSVVKSARGKIVGKTLEIPSPYGPLEFPTWYETEDQAKQSMKAKIGRKKK